MVKGYIGPERVMYPDLRTQFAVEEQVGSASSPATFLRPFLASFQKDASLEPSLHVGASPFLVHVRPFVVGLGLAS